eukprot:6475576-Amphidinium_carterae.1
MKCVQGVWLRPIFAKQTKVDIGGGRTANVKSGTQTIDGFWSHLRTHISGNPSKLSDSLDSMIRMSQYSYWAGGKDPLAMLADTLSREKRYVMLADLQRCAAAMALYGFT